MKENKWFKVKCSACKKQSDYLSSDINYYLCEECLKKEIDKKTKKNDR